ncbi:Ribosomal RNA small subunit methyltransferase H, partial [Dillenia turbinata]
MDLGMSSMQVNNAERGFSVLGNGPLDMRMDPKISLKEEDILNLWPNTEVGCILREYGEESNWCNLQNKIVKARSGGRLHSTGELVDLIRKSAPCARATRVFQALRIAVNDELNTLKTSLYSCFDCLSPGGRLAVISFDSLEDRIAKQTFLDIIGRKSEDEAGSDKMQCRLESLKVENDSREEILTKRPITPSEEEEKLNRRYRSAKLRVIQK